MVSISQRRRHGTLPTIADRAGTEDQAGGMSIKPKGQQMNDDEATATCAIDWCMALAYELANVNVCLTDDHDVGSLVNLMDQIGEYFDGDLAAACNAIRTGTLVFAPDDYWFRIRRS
jgi:hypothetical protein